MIWRALVNRGADYFLSRASPDPLERITRRILSKSPYDKDEMASLLCNGAKQYRLEVNIALATAFLEAGEIAEAAVCADRVMWLSGYDESYQDLYAGIMTLADNPKAIVESYKRAGINALNKGQIGEAVRHCNRSHNALANHYISDRYEFDFEILDRLAEHATRTNGHRLVGKDPGRVRVRVAYLVFGIRHLGSIIVSLLCSFANHHDKDKFEIAFFVPEAQPQDTATEESRAWDENLGKLRASNIPVHIEHVASPATAIQDTVDCLFDFSPDILVTPAVLADFAHYYIAAAKPARRVIGLGYGAPQQFSAPVLDLAICAHKHIVFESLSDCALVNVEVDLPSASTIVPADRSKLGIPEDAVLMFVGGRPPKLQHLPLWQSWLSALESAPALFLAIVGIREFPPSVVPLLSDSLKERIRLFDWNTGQYLQLLRSSDFVSDTYPFGGGVLIMEAMALACPTLTFSHALQGMFDPLNWSAAASFVPEELIVPRDDCKAYSKALERLIKDAGYRRRMGDKCQRMAQARCGSPARMVKAYEAHYLATLEKVQE
jgi:glycosyltransferase involved in cell wall biosynthesis